MLMQENVSVIPGLIVIKGLEAKDFFRNLKISGERKGEKTLLLGAPQVAIGAQKIKYSPSCHHLH